jgi:predicted nucleic acid-binding protein
MGLLIVPPTASVMQLAVDIARTFDITIYDAAFVALAQTLPAAFVTADERLSKRLVAFSFVYFLGEVPV